MSADFIVRLIGMVVFAVIGTYWGAQLGNLAITPSAPTTLSVEEYSFLIGLVGALFGLILTPFFTSRPVRALKKRLTHISASALSAGLIGLIVGLIVAALLTFPLSLLPSPLGKVLPFLGAIVFGYLGVSVFIYRQNDIFTMFSAITRGAPTGKDLEIAGQGGRDLLLDTNVIIDGRIADIGKTKFLPGTLIIPKFVLNELQFIADASDGLRRARGRRGLDVLAQLQKDDSIHVMISDVDIPETQDVDEKLIRLAKKTGCPILTNDYNLNRVAELQGVTVLNINELANAVKTVLLPGETMEVHVIQEGKESSQGVGYMDDGTMIVVENGKKFIDKDISVIVTKILQTAAGKMVFARVEDVAESNRKE
jgi:uncharacterized protein YacL